MKPTTGKSSSLSNGLGSTWNRGQTAEARVAQYLLENGFTILSKNFRWRGGEIDLIALQEHQNERQRVIVFVEVRSSTEELAHLLRYSLGLQKRLRLLKTAQVFAHRNPRLGSLARRFDVVWVEGSRLEHWKNVII